MSEKEFCHECDGEGERKYLIFAAEDFNEYEILPCRLCGESEGKNDKE